MKRKVSKWVGLLVIAAAAGGVLSGCAWSVGEHKDHSLPTRGQELIDLKKARDSGAISEDEFQSQKKRLLGQ